ncbi:hypothetical protein AWB79_02495 [Caballeronia hypogeia]|uniref:DUF3562 domain-containing protein n=2 Tax=Caballeronia hypogeia TaxID=1777140 RepID=A0A158AKC6_9BURK|nr:hypothetical protein AWB79_02495 [Caballeronia hypogeia]
MVQSAVDELVRSIVEDTHASPETVSRICAELLAQFEEEAKIMDYIPLFVAKRVRAYLKADFA